MANEIQIFENGDFSVRTILNEDGSISINAEDTAIGFGWVQTQNKNGKIYSSIRWETLNNYCEDFGFPNKVGKDDYIPESLFYRLGMKASNEKANKFQNWLAINVIPSIRKTGSYSIQKKLDSYMIEDPIKRAERWIEEQKEKQLLQLKIKEQKPLVEFAEQIQTSDDSIDMKAMAKIASKNEIKIGRNKLFDFLRNKKVLNISNEPYESYMERDWFEIKESTYVNYKGDTKIQKTTLVKPKG